MAKLVVLGDKAVNPKKVDEIVIEDNIDKTYSLYAVEKEVEWIPAEYDCDGYKDPCTDCWEHDYTELITVGNKEEARKLLKEYTEAVNAKK